jgi:lupus La protein
MNEEKSDGVEEVKRVDAGETAQSIDKDDKSLSNNDQDIILREDIKEEFTKFGTVRVI